MSCRLQLIEPYHDELYRYMVPSRSQRDPYLVDMQSFGWNGECPCPDFSFRCLPLLVRGSVRAEHLRCHHLREARSYFLDTTLPKFHRAFQFAASDSPAMRAEGAISQIIVAEDKSKTEKILDLRQVLEHAMAGIKQLEAA